MGDYDDAVKYSLLSTVFLWLKFSFCTYYQGYAKIGAGLRAPEDQFVASNVGSETQQSFGVNTRQTGASATDATQNDSLLDDEKTAETAARWNRIVANDLECIPMGLFVIWACTLAGVDSCVLLVINIVFAVGRLGHTICYAFALQPWRTVFWTVGQLSILVLGVYGVIKVFED